tara:strand:- start:36 stop:239 length:204 start_codon:yes stop_codon:yes gene_type:complete
MFEGCTIKYNSYQGTDENDNPKTYNCSVQIIYPDGMMKSVPIDNENTDYQDILQWLADGNTIEEADD